MSIMETAIPRIVIAGVTSGVGKTTVAAGVIGALRARGLWVQPFKCGPDYIDPSHLSRAAGAPARNLDSWMLSEPVMKELFVRGAQGADVAVIEGMMGLFDGRAGASDEGSTAHIAKLLDVPVVLVMDVGKVARSAVAVALGFQRFDPSLALAGVILNNVGGARHREMIEEALTPATGLSVLGALPRDDALAIEERHLGLVPDAEGPLASDQMRRLVEVIGEHVDIDTILAIARKAGPLEVQAIGGLFPEQSQPRRAREARFARIAVAQDRAFSFYYPENIELLEAWGAEIVPFSPLTENALPQHIQGIYIGGGFPEVYARELSENLDMRRSVAAAARSGIPLLAECGGLMYLARSIVDFEGRRHEMVGTVPGDCIMERRRVGLGYLTATARKDTVLLRSGEAMRAHEFHWSRLEAAFPPEQAAFDIAEYPGRTEGYAVGNVLASYAHVHFGARPDLAPRFVDACATWANKR